MAMQKNQKKEFVIGVADVLAFQNGQLLFTGVLNTTTSLEVSMETNDIKAGRGNKLVYSHKYGRGLNATIEAVDWSLEYLALQTGNFISQKLRQVYEINACVDIVEGVGTLTAKPSENADVYCILPNGNTVTVKAKGNTIDLKSHSVTDGMVKATYLRDATTKRVVIDTETQPLIVELIMKADKFDNDLGKIGTVQVTIPRFQADGNLTLEFSNDGTAQTSVSGSALAVLNDRCSDGNEVLGYVDEYDTKEEALKVSQIAVLPADITLAVEEDVELKVIGIKGGMYENILIDNSLCTFTPESETYATATGGVVHGVQEGSTMITVDYNGVKDYVKVTVTGE